MPANFPEMWLKRVEIALKASNVAPWLDGIPELDAPVVELGAGDASESNIIHIPLSDFEPDVLVNNTAYPIALQAYTDSEATIQLDKLQTKVTTLSDDQIIGASYPRIDNATRSHVSAITSKKYMKAAHAIAPSSHSANTPCVATTGANVGTRKRMVYDNIVALKDYFDKLEVPAEGRRLVLSTDHWNDALTDRQNFGDQLVNYKTGQVAPVVAGFEIFSYVSNPYFTQAGAKVAFGAVPGGTDGRASFAFYVGNIAKKTGMTKQYFSKAENDPENQTNKLNYRHYFIAVNKRAKYMGAIYSAASA